ncbi:MAG: molybdopterin-dependent oxidoreductase [Tissierellales bacterium]|nr:molybdopterin-dependent oxidoreductase [Tissierellales bacterium]
MKKTIPIIIVVLVLILFIFLNQDDPYIIITLVENSQEIEGEYIYSYENSLTFPSVIRSSGEKPVSVEFKGIELAEFLKSQNIDLTNSNMIKFYASDGYQIAVKTEEILEPKNVYLVYEMDGEKLKSKKNNGSGPFRIVIRKDPFSQRWIKHLEEILVE